MKLGIEGYRIKKKQIKDAVEARLTEKFGAGPWVIALEDPGIFLDRDLIASKKLDLQQVEWEAGQAAMTLKGMAEFWTSEDLVHGRIPHDRDTPYFGKSYFPSRSGDVILSTRPYSFWGTYAERDTGSTHGSSCEYDTQMKRSVGSLPSDHAGKATDAQIDFRDRGGWVMRRRVTSPARHRERA